jgi:serine/threonine-protein kinase
LDFDEGAAMSVLSTFQARSGPAGALIVGHDAGSLSYKKPLGEDAEVSDPRVKDEGSATESATLRAGKLLGVVISGRYRVDEILAVGGMGVVYRGTHVHMRKRVAIKVLLPETKGLPNLVARFEREAIAGAHIHHTNIASATDFGRLDDGSYFLIQEYARGTTLSAIIKRGPLAVQRSVRITRQLASALKAAHEMGVIHRDLKPRNVMIDEERSDLVKLIDFGLSKVPVEQIASAQNDEDEDEEENRELTTVGVVFGTIAYMSPEAGLGMWAVDERSDLYALGIMLYEMLAGRHPFDGTEPGELFYQQRSVIPGPIATRTPGVNVPPAVEAIVTRLVMKDPTNRYQSAQEVIEAIDAAMPGVSEIIIPPEKASSGAGTSFPPPPSSGRQAKVRNSPTPTAAEGVPSSKKVEALPAVPAPPTATQVEIKEAPASSVTPPSTKPASPAALKAIKTAGVEGKPAARASGPGQQAPLPPPPVMDANLPEESRPATTKKVAAPEKKDPGKKASSAEAAKTAESRSSSSSSSSASAPAFVQPSQPSMPYVPLVPVRERRSRSSAAEWAVRVGALVVLLGAGVVFWMRSKGSLTWPKSSATTEAVPTASMVAPTETARPAGTATDAPAAATGAPAQPAPEQNGNLRDRMRKAAENKQWDEGAKALVDLAKTEPAAFSDKDVATAASQIAGGLGPDQSTKVLEALGAAEQGPDLLYDIGAANSGSPVGDQAFEILDSKEVLDRASPALRVTLELRRAECMDKALNFKKAKKEGDQRTVDYLESLRSGPCRTKKGVCCFPGNTLLDSTIRGIQARLAAKP